MLSVFLSCKNLVQALALAELMRAGWGSLWDLGICNLLAQRVEDPQAAFFSPETHKIITN